MRINWKKVCLYGICAVLAGFYLLVLWWGKNPNVEDEYRMYYITHELSDWPGYGNLSYEPGTLEYMVSLKDRNGKDRSVKVCQTKGTGWEEEQYEGSVSKGDTSYVYFKPVKTSETAVLKFNISSYEGTGKLTVYVNNTQVGTVDKSGDYAFSFNGYKKDELITVRYESAEAVFTMQTIEID